MNSIPVHFASGSQLKITQDVTHIADELAPFEIPPRR